MPKRRRCDAPVAALCAALWMGAPPVAAQVVFDGSLGPYGPAPLRSEVPGLEPLPGIDRDIVVLYDERIADESARHGRPRGTNLFHSLETLGVSQAPGDCAPGTYCRSVTFHALDEDGQPLPFDNVIARVTQEGSPSVFQGLLRSDIPGANLFLLNPAGIVFEGQGEGNQLDVDGGSVFLSTADSLRFSDGLVVREFRAEKAPLPELLVGDPVSFGFLGGGSGEVALIGSRTMEVDDGEDITIVASSVLLDEVPIGPGEDRSSQLQVRNGTARVAAVGSAAVDVPLAVETWDVAGMQGQLGQITLVEDAFIGNAGLRGRVVLRGGRLVIDDSRVRGAGTTAAPALDVAMADAVEVRNFSVLAVDTTVDTGSLPETPGDPGVASGRIVAPRLDVRSGDRGTTVVGVLTSSNDAPEVGRFEIDAGSIVVTDGGSVVTLAQQRTPGADLEIRADVIEVRDGLISSQTDPSSARPGGNLRIDTRTLQVTGGSGSDGISGITTQSGGGRAGSHAGDLTISATESITIEEGSQIATVAGEFGDHGDVSISTGTLIVRSDGQLGASNEPGRLGGDFQIGASTIRVEGGGAIVARPAGIGSEGQPNALAISTSTLDVRSGGRIETTNLTDGGAPGPFHLDADAITVEGDGSRISAEAGELGDGGDLLITTGTLAVRSGGQISTTTTTDRNGGSLSVTAAGLVEIVGDGADVSGLFARSGSTSDGIGSGDGGSLTVSADRLEMTGESAVSTRSLGVGRSGELLVTAADRVTLRGDANGSPVISGRVVDGDGSLVTVAAPRIELLSGGAIASSTFGLGRAGAIELGREGPTDLPTVRDVRIEGRSPSGNRSEILSESVASLQRPETGPGGAITVTIDGSLEMRDGGRISSRSSSTGMGDAGDITLSVGGDVDLVDADVTAEATDASGGEITLTAGGAVSLLRSQLATSVLGRDGEGDGGNLTLGATPIVVNASTLLARATRGDGGNITVISDAYLESTDSLVDASSDLGKDGEIDVPPPDVALKAALARLPSDFRDAATLLESRCAARASRRGSFIVRGREGLAESPARPLSAPMPLPADLSAGAPLDLDFESSSSVDCQAEPDRSGDASGGGG